MKILKIIPVLIFVFLIGGYMGLKGETRDIPKNLVRFHIVADSNDKEAQSVKWRVREAIFNEFDFEADSKEEAINYFNTHKNEIKAVADRILKENNMPYESEIFVGKKYFPVKKYDSFVLPSGEYDSVSVVLGEGDGENFFCVMYPSVCTVSSITFENPEVFMGVLSSRELEAVTDNSQKTVVKFKIAEILDKFMSK